MNPAEQGAEKRTLQKVKNSKSCRTASPAGQRTDRRCRLRAFGPELKKTPSTLYVEQRILQNDGSCRTANPAEQRILQNNERIAGAGCGPSARNLKKTPSALYVEQRILQNNGSCRTANPEEQQILPNSESCRTTNGSQGPAAGLRPGT